MSGKLVGFKGRLSPSQIADGMNLANKNAARLVKDAEVLLANGSFPTALSLAALAIEEAGKVSVLRGLALAKSDADARECWKEYRSHTKKNVAWILPDLARAGAKKLEDLRPLVAADSDHPQVLDNLKQLGFYTDCLGSVRWSNPCDAIPEELAKLLVSTARLLCSRSVHTEREVELWIEHLGPVWKQDMPIMMRAIVEWQDAMHREGLSVIDADAMSSFVHGAVV